MSLYTRSSSRSQSPQRSYSRSQSQSQYSSRSPSPSRSLSRQQSYQPPQSPRTYQIQYSDFGTPNIERPQLAPPPPQSTLEYVHDTAQTGAKLAGAAATGLTVAGTFFPPAAVITHPAALGCTTIAGACALTQIGAAAAGGGPSDLYTQAANVETMASGAEALTHALGPSAEAAIGMPAGTVQAVAGGYRVGRRIYDGMTQEGDYSMDQAIGDVAASVGDASAMRTGVQTDMSGGMIPYTAPPPRQPAPGNPWPSQY